MNYVVTTPRKQRKAYLVYRKGKKGNVLVPVDLQGAATDISMLEVAKLNPLASVGTRILQEANHASW